MTIPIKDLISNLDGFLIPAVVLFGLKYLFQWVGFLMPEERDQKLRDYLLDLKEKCKKVGILIAFHNVINILNEYIIRNKLTVFSVGIVTSIILNIASYFLLKAFYADLTPYQSSVLFINYDVPFFASLVVWDVFSLYVTFSLIWKLTKVTKIYSLALIIMFDVVVLTCLGKIQFVMGINFNTLMTNGVEVFEKHGLKLWQLVEIQWVFFFPIVVLICTKFYHNMSRWLKVVIVLVFLALAFVILESYYYTAREFFDNTPSPAPKDFLTWVPQANSRALVIFNLSSMFPSVLYVVLLSSLVMLNFMPQKVYTFVALHLQAVAKDKEKVMTRLGWIFGFLLSILLYVILP